MSPLWRNAAATTAELRAHEAQPCTAPRSERQFHHLGALTGSPVDLRSATPLLTGELALQRSTIQALIQALGCAPKVLLRASPISTRSLTLEDLAEDQGCLRKI